MFYSWSLLIGSIIYVLAGIVMTKVTRAYLKELEKDVANVDYRYVRRMYFALPAKTERQKDIWEVVLLAIWPVFCIAAILKAEWQYDIIVRHAVNRPS